MSALCERHEIAEIRRQHRPAGLGESHDERIDSGASTGPRAQPGGSPGQRLPDLLHDVARL